MHNFLTAIGTVVYVCAVSIFFLEGYAEPGSLDREGPSMRSEVLQTSKKSLVHLYYADRENYFLMSERRVLLHPDDPVLFGKAIVEALIKGPQQGLIRTIPADTELRAIYITPDSVCYIDLTLAARKNHPGGCNSELLTVYSIVNSLILNVPEI
jgi:hypothetical protein